MKGRNQHAWRRWKKIAQTGVGAPFFLCCLFSCSLDKQEPSPDPLRARVLRLLPVPDGQSSTQLPVFELAEVSFEHVTSPTLQGAFFRVFHGSERSAGMLSFGEPLMPDFRVQKNRVVLPTNYRSLLIYSAVYQCDQMLGFLKHLLPLPSAEVSDFLNLILPVYVLFAPSVAHPPETNRDSWQVFDKANAAHQSLLSWWNPVFSFNFPATQEKVPLAANLQVVAHEWGHFLVQHFVWSKQGQEGPRDLPIKLSLKGYTATQREDIAGVDEGIADFLSYVVTGSSDVLSASFGGAVSMWRKFDQPPSAPVNMKQCVSQTSARYCWGSCWAYLFKKLLENLEGTSFPTAAQRARFFQCFLRSHQFWGEDEQTWFARAGTTGNLMIGLLSTSMRRWQDRTRGLPACGYALPGSETNWQNFVWKIYSKNF